MNDANSLLQPRDLSPTEKEQLVDKLLSCHTMRNRNSRNQVVQELSFADSIERDSNTTDKVDVMNIVNRCLDFSDGLQQLIERVEYREDGSQSLQHLSHFLRILLSSSIRKASTAIAKPLKKQAILDRRFATAIVVLFSRSGESVDIDPRIPGLLLFSLGLYEQLLVENIYGSALAIILNRERDVLGTTIKLFETPQGQEDKDFIMAVKDAEEAWKQDSQFQLIVSEYEGLKGSHLGNQKTNIPYLETTLRLAKQLDAAIIPHPDRWYLYSWWFEHNIWTTGNETSKGIVAPLSDPVLGIPKIKMERLTRLSAKLAIPFQQNIALAHYGPLPYPFPEGLLRYYDREDLASFPPFLYEFCIPAPSV